MTKPNWTLNDIAPPKRGRPPKATDATSVATDAIPSPEPIETPEVTEPDKPKRAGRPAGIVETTKRSRRPKLNAPPPPDIPYTLPDLSHAPAQEFGERLVEANNKL